MGWTEGVWWSGMGSGSDPLSVPLKEGKFKEDKTLLRRETGLTGIQPKPFTPLLIGLFPIFYDSILNFDKEYNQQRSDPTRHSSKKQRRFFEPMQGNNIGARVNILKNYKKTTGSVVFGLCPPNHRSQLPPNNYAGSQQSKQGRGHRVRNCNHRGGTTPCVVTG